MMARRPVASSARRRPARAHGPSRRCGPNTVPGAVSGTRNPRHPSMPDVPRPLPNPYAAYLRVYEPLAAFPERDRATWSDYARPARRPAPTGWSPSTGPRWPGCSRPAAPGAGRRGPDAFVLEVEGLPHVCPVQSRLRSWAGARPVPRRAARPAAARVRPAGVAGRGADADHAGLGHRRVRHRAADPHRDLARPAAVVRPVRAEADRVAADGRRAERRAPDPDVGCPAPGGPGAAHAADRLGDLDVELDVVDELEDLGRWLEEFHPRSWVELDYGGLVRLLGPEVVAEDTSAGRRGRRGGRARRRGRGGRGAHLPHRGRTAGRPWRPSSTPTDRPGTLSARGTG